MREDADTLYRFVFESAHDPTIVLDAQGRLVLSNFAAGDLRGALVERMIARGEPRAAELDAFRERLAAEGRAQAEIRLDGRAITLEGWTYAEHTVVRVRDVTDQRRIEAELRALRRLESIGHFTASLIHDFNNLLTPIACLSGCLEASLASDERAQEMARDIRTAAEKAAGLARQTLRWVRREPPHTEVIDVSAVLSELQPLLERVVGREVRVDVVAAANTGAAALDREQLEHALLNLAANARDAMPSGGRLTLSTATASLDEREARRIEGARAGAHVVVRVMDDGIGMKLEVRDRIFQRLYSTKEAGAGTGLGLQAVKRFVAESGGFMSVQSEEGRGTTVSLHFPVAALDPPRASPERGAEPGGSELVLVVDDDDRVRGAVAAVLRSHGYRVRAAAGGEEAVEIVRRTDPVVDVVVADVVMPGMSGLELAERLRAVRPTRMLFTSGHTERRLELLGWRPEDGLLLRKAFTPSDLLRKVREALDAGEPRPLRGRSSRSPTSG